MNAKECTLTRWSSLFTVLSVASGVNAKLTRAANLTIGEN